MKGRRVELVEMVFPLNYIKRFYLIRKHSSAVVQLLYIIQHLPYKVKPLEPAY